MLDYLSPRQIQENLRNSARNIWLAGLGAASSIEEESSNLFEEMIERGRKAEKRRMNQVENAVEEVEDEFEDFFGKMNNAIDQRMTEALRKVGVPTRKEIQMLTARVEQLTESVERMNVANRKAETKSTAKSTSTATAKSTAKTSTAKTTEKTATTELERKVYHVTAYEEGWRVKAEGAERASLVADTKEEAVDAARELAKKQEPSQVVVHKMDGTIQTHYAYGETSEEESKRS